MALSRISPLSVPVLLEIGRESVRSTADEDALLAEAEALIAEAMDESESGSAQVPARPVPPVHPVDRANLARRAVRQPDLFNKRA